MPAIDDVIINRASDVLEIRKGEGTANVAMGVVGMLVGAGCTAFGVHGVIAGGSPPDVAPPIVPALFGLPFLLLGARFALYRRWVSLDARQRVVVRRSGFLVPMWRTEIPFEEIARIERRLIAAPSEGAAPSHDADLLFRDGNRLTAYHGPDRDLADAVASRLAGHLGVQVEDLTDRVI